MAGRRQRGDAALVLVGVVVLLSIVASASASRPRSLLLLSAPASKLRAQRCGTHAPEEPARLRLERAHAVRAAREAAEPQRVLEVPTYVTIVRRNGDNGPLVSDDTVQAQLDVLNKAYGTTPGSKVFVLKDLVRVEAPPGGSMCDKDVETAVKAAHRKGPAGALNLYIADLSDCGLLGYSTWPWDVKKGDLLADDGVVIHHSTLPGGTYQPYHLGGTAVHEIGHWLGLYHVFEHGCDAPGDSVDDTAYAAGPTEGCPKKTAAKKTSCPGKNPGPDPVGNNPMDYADDACMETFTAVSLF